MLLLLLLLVIFLILLGFTIWQPRWPMIVATSVTGAVLLGVAGYTAVQNPSAAYLQLTKQVPADCLQQAECKNKVLQSCKKVISSVQGAEGVQQLESMIQARPIEEVVNLCGSAARVNLGVKG